MIMIAAVAVLAIPAFSQGCALCYTQAAQSGEKMIAALKSGILILIAPPTFGSIGLIFVVYRKRNRFKASDETLELDDRDWLQPR